MPRLTTLTAALLIATLPIGAQRALAQQAQSGVPVSTATVTRQDIPLFTSGIGTVQALQSVLIRARVDGTVERIAFTEGQDVKVGDVLATIDPRPYQAALDQALAKKAADTAMLGNAKRDLARYSDLARSEFASRQSVDTQQASVSQTTATTQADDAAIAAAKLNLDFTRITSPIEGKGGVADGGRRQPGPCERRQWYRDHQPGPSNLGPVHLAAGHVPHRAGLHAGLRRRPRSPSRPSVAMANGHSRQGRCSRWTTRSTPARARSS